MSKERRFIDNKPTLLALLVWHRKKIAASVPLESLKFHRAAWSSCLHFYKHWKVFKTVNYKLHELRTKGKQTNIMTNVFHFFALYYSLPSSSSSSNIQRFPFSFFGITFMYIQETVNDNVRLELNQKKKKIKKKGCDYLQRQQLRR